MTDCDPEKIEYYDYKSRSKEQKESNKSWYSDNICLKDVRDLQQTKQSGREFQTVTMRWEK